MLMIYYFSMVTFKISSPDIYVISSNIFANWLEGLYKNHTQQKHGGYYLTLCKNYVEIKRTEDGVLEVGVSTPCVIIERSREETPKCWGTWLAYVELSVWGVYPEYGEDMEHTHS